MSKEEREKPNKNLGFHHHEKDYDDEKHIDEVKHVHPDYYKRGNKDKAHHAKPPRYINKENVNKTNDKENKEGKNPTRSASGRNFYHQERSFSRNKAMRKMQNENNATANQSNARNDRRLQKEIKKNQTTHENSTNKEVKTSNKENN